MDIVQEKTRAREAMRERLRQLKPEVREAESRSICRRILENLSPAPLTICIYQALPSEASLAMLLPALWDRGDNVFLARFLQNRLSFGQIYEETTLLKGTLGILEPPLDSPAPSIEGVDIVLTPALAFDRKGARLGRGNGGYDKWISLLRSANTHAQVWGLALDCQLLRELPTEAHDERMDGVITPREFLKIKKTERR